MSWNSAVPFQNRSVPFHIRGVGKGTVGRSDFRAHRNPSRAREHPHKSAWRHVSGSSAFVPDVALQSFVDVNYSRIRLSMCPEQRTPMEVNMSSDLPFNSIALGKVR